MLLALDLRDVGFVDSSGLAVLVQARRDAGSWGGTVRVVNASPQVRRLLTITQLAPLFFDD